MAATSAISQVPADVIAHILSNLEAIEDLAVAIRSHRIFLNAFNEGPYSIARAIVKSQIPSDATPLVAALLESSRIDHGAGIDISREILDRLTSAISDPNQTTLFYVSKLSLSELAFCSRIYATAESLAYKMAAEVKPIAIQKLDFGCSTLQHLTSTEKARLVRAFLRFQLLCDLFCPPDSACPLSNDGNSEERAMENKLRFFSMYSPWVNEHLIGFFAKATFDELAWHDVDWGEMPVDNSIEPDENFWFQGFLSRGLGFLSDISRTDSYVSWARLLRLGGDLVRDFKFPSQQFYYRFPDQRFVEAIGLPDLDTPLQDWTAGQLRSLSQRGNGSRDSTESSSYSLWFGANAGRSIFGESSDVQEMDDDTNLWQLGYNVWDWDFQNTTSRRPLSIRKACGEVRSMPPPFKPDMQFNDEVMLRSQRQRSDIYLAGGCGYWPMGGAIDFGGIQGLSPDKIADLLYKWGIDMDMQINSTQSIVMLPRSPHYADSASHRQRVDS
ncbi:unnamed protein product [Clonostachys rosea f. rosea IK726]|uniref:Uncharacterized protein n=1 Tax=Clonostachys rosea f. rosea IK726 TaxID=1349383 RepID=A0ACA9UTG5_BIOOC|nr:unnamed protein product [Clonostachys rosea f. rosea IK726]